jgi:hypothetical protein
VRGPLHVFDPLVPQSARIYDSWLGGKDHYETDRDVATRVMERRPEVAVAARANRLFLNRAVRYVAKRHVVTQFLDIGAGLPTADNTHVIAQRIDPRSRIVYVDRDRSLSGSVHVVGSPEGSTHVTLGAGFVRVSTGSQDEASQELLPGLSFRTAILAIGESTDLNQLGCAFSWSEVTRITGNDFLPPQSSVSRIVKVVRLAGTG